MLQPRLSTTKLPRLSVILTVEILQSFMKLFMNKINIKLVATKVFPVELYQAFDQQTQLDPFSKKERVAENQFESIACPKLQC